MMILVQLACVSCSNEKTDEINNIVTGPRILSLKILADQNPELLIEDVNGQIEGDSVINCWIPNLVSEKNFKINIIAQGDIYINGQQYKDGSIMNFKKPVTISVLYEGERRDYTIYVHSYTGLPVMWIETVGRQEITSKEEYLIASFKLVENAKSRAAGDIISDSVKIKGRGNSSWLLMPKKSYRLKLFNKQPLLDETADKSWVLLSNYADKTMLRNQLAFYVGHISNLEYTPASHFVELMLNGRYNGTYLLCDKLKISGHRVNVGPNGFLLEIDATPDSNDVVFNIPHLYSPVNIKDPDVQYGDTNFLFVKNCIETIDNVLYSNNFTDSVNGWQKYMDITSFVDWYLINEITKNNDACLFSSCYMSLSRDSKLKMGPIWDFDLCLGNTTYNTSYEATGFLVKNSTWFSRLFEDPVFVEMVKNRFEYFYSQKENILSEINRNATYLKYAVQENDNRWQTLNAYTWPNYDIWGRYYNEIQSLKEWMNTRFEWLRAEYDKM